MTVRVHLIGIGDDGLLGLHPDARKALENADIIIGGARHLDFIVQTQAEKWHWPSPFDALLKQVRKAHGKHIAVLVTGDPLWYSAGEQFVDAFGVDNLCIYPHVGAFQLAAARMGWSIQNTITLSLHGRSANAIIKYLAPNQRILALSNGTETLKALIDILHKQGFGDSVIHAVSHLGGINESRVQIPMAQWHGEIPQLSTLAIEVVHDGKSPIYSRTTVLPDDAFVHDGKMTKQIIRAASLARLRPQSGQMLWDIGAGCGSIGIEWLRQTDHASAIGVEPHAERRAMAVQNAQNLGTTELRLIDGYAMDVLADLPTPDAVFIGGGLCEDLAHICYGALRPQGRFVANAVTLESEAILLKLHETLGGVLERIQIAHANSIGNLHAWRPVMPITQFSVIKT